MKVNFKLKRLPILCTLFSLFILIAFSEVNALEVNFDGIGNASVGSGGGGRTVIDGKYNLALCSAVKVNLVKIGSSGPEWLTFYYLFDDTNATGKTTYQLFTNTKGWGQTNMITTASGETGVIGQIYPDGYSPTGAYIANNIKLSDWGQQTFFIAGNGTGNMYTFDVSLLERNVKGIAEGQIASDTFYKVLYALLTTNKQHNMVKWNELMSLIDMSGISSWSDLKASMENHPENWTGLKDYRIIFEPIYRWQRVDQSRSQYLFTTLKAGAHYVGKGEFGGIGSESNYLNNCNATKTHGSIQPAGSSDNSLSGMLNVNSGRGYAIVTIINDVQKCDPTVSCCYSGDGTYNATPATPPENEMTYRCEGTVNSDNSCSVEVTSCGTPLREGVCNPDEEGPFYNYYMFLASTNKDYINSTALTMHTTAENTEFKDKEIFEKLIKDMDPSLNYSLNYIRVLDDASGVVNIDSSNYEEFYKNLIRARDATNSYFQSGNDYYITHKRWCKVNAPGDLECTDTTRLTMPPSYYMNRSIYVKTLNVRKMKNSEGTGYAFDLVRTLEKGLDNQLFMSSAPVKDDSIFHPAEYRIAYCVTKKEEPNCDDEVNPATCMAGGTKPIFHESDDLKTCTIKKDNHSGFVAIDQTSDIDQAEEDTSKYCTMACKEDLDIELPGEKETAAGQYFKLDEYTPKISAKRTCVTTEIKYSDFDNDLKAIEPDIPKQFNIWHDHYEIAEHLNGGSVSSNTSTQTIPNDTSKYNVETKTCKIATSRIEEYCKTEKNVDENDTDAMDECKENNKDHEENYLLESYTYNGKEYQYVVGGGIYCDDDKRSGYGAVKNSSGSWNALSNDDTLPKDQQALSYEKRAGRTNAQATLNQYQSSTPSSTNNSQIGEVVKGTGVCYKSHDDGSVSGPYSYEYEIWEIYSYTPALSSETGVTYGGRTGTYSSDQDCMSGSDPKYDDAVNEEFNTQRALASQASYTYYQTLRKYQETMNNFNRCFNWVDTTKDYNIVGTFSWNSVGSLRPFDQNGRYDSYNYEFEPSVSYWYEDQDGGIFPVTYDYEYKNTDDNNHKGNGYVESTGFKTEMAYWKDVTIDEKYSGSTSVKGSVPSRGQNSEDRNIITCDPDAAKCTSSDTTATPFYRSSYLKRIESVSYTYHLPRVVSSIPDGKVHLKTNYSGNKPTVELDLDASPVNINTRKGTYDYKMTISKLKDDLRARKSSGSVEYNDINTHQSKTVSGDSTNQDDNYEERFDNGNGTTTEPVLDVSGGTDYLCNYKVINDIYIPDDPKLNFFYRIIDPANINPTGRPLGYNWNDTRAISVIDRMEANENDYQDLIDEDNGTFEFTLTPLIMKQIRAYNAKETNSGGYADWDLECHDYEDKNGNPDSQGYHCYSTFLTCLTSKGAVASPGDGTSCHSIFGSSLNATNYNPEYDLEKLRQNRENLLTKQKALDCSNNNAFLNKACGG